MELIFTYLTRAVDGTPPLALTAAIIWGILSVILSPCHLAGIPLIAGFLSGQGNISRRTAIFISSTFAFGILATITAMGVITAAMGKMLGDTGAYGNYIVAAVFFIVGANLIGLLPFSWCGPGYAGMRRKGIFAAFLLGILFGTALGPCTFAFMAPVLAVSFRAASTNALYASLLLLAYGIGHCGIIAAAGASMQTVQRYLKWSQESSGVIITRRVCGALVIAAGVYMLYFAI